MCREHASLQKANRRARRQQAALQQKAVQLKYHVRHYTNHVQQHGLYSV